VKWLTRSTELEERDAKGHDFFAGELETLRERAAEIDRLEGENRLLQAQVLRFQQNERKSLEPAAERSQTGSSIENASAIAVEVVHSPQLPDKEQAEPEVAIELQPGLTEPDNRMASCPLNQAKKWEIEYSKLAARYLALQQNFDRCKDMLRKKTEDVKTWTEYADSLEFKVSSYRKKRGSNLSGSVRSTEELYSSRPASRRSMAGGFVDSDTSTPRTSLNSSFELKCPPIKPVDDVAQLNILSQDTDAVVGLKDSESVEKQRPPHSSQETKDATEEPAVLELPMLPSVISGPPTAFVKPEPSSDSPTIVEERVVRKRKHDGGDPVSIYCKVKTEYPSSDHDQDRNTEFSPHESLDLDEVGRRFPTPRKRKMNATLEIFNDGHSEAIPQNNTALGTPMQFHDPAGDSGQEKVRTVLQTSILMPISTNNRLLRTYMHTPAEKTPRKGLSSGIRSLAEDGSAFKKSAGNLIEIETPSRGGDDGGRLFSLLNTRTPDADPAVLRPNPRLRGISRSHPDKLAVPERRELPFTKNSRNERLDTPKSARPPPNSTVSNTSRPGTMARSIFKRPYHALRDSLRSGPPSTLRLEDFKINPRFNGGHDFAFSEVVRGKGDREVLPGCVDMNCCGMQVRALALTHFQTRPNTPEQRRVDHILLEDYLGDEAFRLMGMSKEEKDELWVEAKMRELANKHGKHRHRFARMKSPPGFWRTDFPDTQEMEADKKLAEEREKEMIQERYKEAMRPGGRWIFRDE
jgi:hypothetical protein